MQTIIYSIDAKSLQSCSTLCSPIDGSPSGSPVPGILQARPLEWVAISFSNAWKWKVKVKPLSPVWLLATPWTAAYRAPPSMGFSRQEYCSGVPLLSYIYIYIYIHTHTHTHTHIEREHAHSIWKQEITHSFLYEYEPFSIRDHNLGHKEASVNLRKI